MRSTNVGRVKFVHSTVDETLFGERTKAREPVRVPAFEPPWVEGGKAKTKTPSKPLLFYCPGSSTPPVSSHPRCGPLRAYKPVQFSPTYVDETLFGKRRTKRSNSPPPSEFNPPWVKESEEKRDRPILFDCNSRLLFDNSCGEFDATSSTSSRSRTPRSSRSSSRASSRAHNVGNTPKSASKPPWR